MKTLLAATAALVSITSASAAEQTLLATFSGCVGRLSAQMEHQWLINDSQAAQTEAVRASMIELLDLVSTPESRRASFHLRVDAKYAQAVLLTRATFNDDPQDAAWARTRAETEIAACQSLLLS